MKRAVADCLAPGESLKRHPECVCASEHYECGTYTCNVCHRERPWCLGGADELEERFGAICDDCWCLVDRFEVAVFEALGMGELLGDGR